MNYNPNIHHRKSIRLKEYDYSKEGLYFITICCDARKHLFGVIVDGKMILNEREKLQTNVGWIYQTIFQMPFYTNTLLCPTIYMGLLN